MHGLAINYERRDYKGSEREHNENNEEREREDLLTTHFLAVACGALYSRRRSAQVFYVVCLI